MTNILKVALVLIFCSSLSGCFEVEDNGVAAAIVAQNAILQAQLDAENVEKYPITLFGSIFNNSTSAGATDAMLSIKVGAEWRETVSVSSDFVIEELLVKTDFLVVISSASGAFLERAFYGQTISVESGQVASQSLGILEVSEGISHSFSILDNDSNESIEGLVFEYTLTDIIIGSPGITSTEDYVVTSTYDEQSERYTIITPLDLSVKINASRDIDGAG